MFIEALISILAFVTLTVLVIDVLLIATNSAQVQYALAEAIREITLRPGDSDADKTTLFETELEQAGLDQANATIEACFFPTINIISGTVDVNNAANNRCAANSQLYGGPGDTVIMQVRYPTRFFFGLFTIDIFQAGVGRNEVI